MSVLKKSEITALTKNLKSRIESINKDCGSTNKEALQAIALATTALTQLDQIAVDADYEVESNSLDIPVHKN